MSAKKTVIMTALLTTLGVQVLVNITVNGNLSNQSYVKFLEVHTEYRDLGTEAAGKLLNAKLKALTDSGLTVSQSISQDHSATLPEGYIAYPDIGAAYKIVRAIVNWTEARKRCFDEGANLAVINTRQKLDHIKSKLVVTVNMHVGIHRIEWLSDWVSIISGEVLHSLPWHPEEPVFEGHYYNCVMAYDNASDVGLYNRDCGESSLWNGDYVCELPIPFGYMKREK